MKEAKVYVQRQPMDVHVDDKASYSETLTTKADRNKSCVSLLWILTGGILTS